MLICQFTRNLALSEPYPGGRFELYDGTVVGEYISLLENEKIQMKWKFKNWPNYAYLIITFSNFDDSSTVTVDYLDLPVEQRVAFQNFWIDEIFKKMQPVFGHQIKEMKYADLEISSPKASNASDPQSFAIREKSPQPKLGQQSPIAKELRHRLLLIE